MTANEFRKKGGFLRGDTYGLGIVLAGATEDLLINELRQAKEVLLSWIGQRGTSGDLVMFTVTSVAMHDAADATLRDIVAHEKDLAGPLQKRTVIISLLGRGREPASQATWSAGRWT